MCNATNRNPRNHVDVESVEKQKIRKDWSELKVEMGKILFLPSSRFGSASDCSLTDRCCNEKPTRMLDPRLDWFCYYWLLRLCSVSNSPRSPAIGRMLAMVRVSMKFAVLVTWDSLSIARKLTEQNSHCIPRHHSVIIHDVCIALCGAVPTYRCSIYSNELERIAIASRLRPDIFGFKLENTKKEENEMKIVLGIWTLHATVLNINVPTRSKWA